MIVIIGGKTIKGNIRITVHSEKEDVPLDDGYPSLTPGGYP